MIRLPLYVKVKDMRPGDILNGREIREIVASKRLGEICLIYSSHWKVRFKNDREWIWRNIEDLL